MIKVRFHFADGRVQEKTFESYGIESPRIIREVVGSESIPHIFEYKVGQEKSDIQHFYEVGKNHD